MSCMNFYIIKVDNGGVLMNVVMRVLEIPALIIGLFVLFYGIALIYNLVIGMFKKDFSKFKEYFNSFRSIANKYSLVYSGVFVVCIFISPLRDNIDSVQNRPRTAGHIFPLQCFLCCPPQNPRR